MLQLTQRRDVTTGGGGGHIFIDLTVQISIFVTIYIII